MAISQEAREHVLDLFQGVGDVTTRSMMGGLCLYSNGQIFAILASTEQIYLKADGDFAQELEALGCQKFSMTRKDGSVGSMGYWTLPDSAMDDPQEAASWGHRALAALR